MKTVLMDNEWLAVTLPDGFSDADHAELESLIGIKYDRLWGTQDTVRHMLLYITWKDSSKLLTKLISEKEVAKRSDKTFAKCDRSGTYRCDGYFERDIAGADAKAQGFRFSYVVEGVAQEGEVQIFKRGTRCYRMCYYTRSVVADENRPVYEDILASLEVR